MPIDGETMNTVADFIFLASKIIADDDCGHEIKRLLLLGSKAMTSLDRILKSRDITLLTKVHLVKAMVFPVVMYGCESWTIKKAECQRIDAFELLCWRRLLRVSSTGKEMQPVHPKENQSWIFIRKHHKHSFPKIFLVEGQWLEQIGIRQLTCQRWSLYTSQLLRIHFFLAKSS